MKLPGGIGVSHLRVYDDGGTPHLHTAFTEAYAVIPARTQSDITASYLPGWDGMRMWVLARPLSGAVRPALHGTLVGVPLTLAPTEWLGWVHRPARLPGLPSS